MSIETSIMRDAQGLAIGVRFTFADGKGALPELTILASELQASIVAEAICHGLKQKVGDAAAIGRDKDTGASASVGDKRVAMCEVAKQLQGEGATWNRKAAKGEGTGGEGLFLLALSQVTGKPGEECKAILATMSVEEQKALKRDPAVIRATAEIQATRARASTDTGALLAKFAPQADAVSINSPELAKQPEAKANAESWPGGKKAKRAAKTA